MKSYQSLGQLFLTRTQIHPGKNAIGKVEGDIIRFHSYKEYAFLVDQIAAGLNELGLKAGDKVSIISQTRVEWHLCDMGILNAQGTVVPIYPNYIQSEVDWVLEHSESKFMICENEAQINKLKSSQKFQKLERIILIESEEVDLSQFSNLNIIKLSELMSIGRRKMDQRPKLIQMMIDEIEPSTIATIIYTSGTTGLPKGAVITHEAILAMLSNIENTLTPQVGENDRNLIFLPLSHVLGRCDSYLHLIFGLESLYAQSIEKIIDNLKTCSPTFMIAVPRIFEKIYERINIKISKESHLKQAAFKWGLSVGKNYFDKLDQDLAPETSEVIQKNLAYKLVFKKIYEQFGGRIRFFVSGGAPLNKEIVEFLRNANLTILEGYGLTETIAPCTLNPLSKQISGTVGIPLGDVQLKFAEDSEILIKTKALFTAYYKNDEATREAFTEGFFKTGDIGELTQEGYLKITDRKKDIIITSGGKNVAPQKIESAAKLSPYIAQFVVIGDQKKYLAALVGIEQEAFAELLPEYGLDRHCSFEELAGHQLTHDLIKNEIEKLNQGLPRHEQIKQFKLLTTELTQENGYLTASLKIKRKKVVKDYEKEIDSLYQ